MGVKWVKIREKIAALVAILVVIFVIAMASVVFGWNIPIIFRHCSGTWLDRH